MIYRLNLNMDPAILLQLWKKKLCCVSVSITENNAICKLKMMIDLKFFIFLVLTEKTLKLLLCQVVTMIGLWDWPITVGHL